ncbi:hypothetical protein OXPF_18380 [Oxobacter pfennigii]|uniref:DUF2812 domain-containing protein n=1 Tax=Oxobacter pfennigii TaxID=36849 RepID=A0A0N8NTG3_9CLOT|nr:DUF2812 domain-containing protein [Oxobacter pfennigii]KPU44752.1 hypothetical protein OXPF_18380 [Oxobacter pfennigii]
MNKISYKLLPWDEWRIGERESWFQDMAAKGQHLVKAGKHFAKFKKGEPKDMRYRVDVSNFALSEERKKAHEENGWDYVTEYGDFCVFSSSEELSAPELYDDPEEQSHSLKAVWKKSVISLLLLIGAIILLLLIIFSSWALNRIIVLKLIETAIYTSVYFTVLYSYYIYYSIKAVISIGILQRRLKDGKPIDHNAPWRKYKAINTAIAVIHIIIIMSLFTIAFVSFKMNTTEELPLYDTNLPIVRLHDVEKNPGLVSKTTYINNNIDYGNSIGYGWSPLAPEQYKSQENGVVPEAAEVGTGEYSPSISTSVYKLSLPFLADRVIDELMTRYFWRMGAKDYTEINSDSFDRLLICDSGDFKEVLASRNKGVMYVGYSGRADIDTLLENISHKMSLVSH